MIDLKKVFTELPLCEKPVLFAAALGTSIDFAKIMGQDFDVLARKRVHATGIAWPMPVDD